MVAGAAVGVGREGDRRVAMATAGQTERNRRATLAQIGRIGLNQTEPADEGDYESQQIPGGKP